MTATIPFSQTTHLIEQQYAAEQQFLQQFAAASYTPEAPLIIVTPYLIAPLTALVMFRTAKAQSVQLKVCGKEPAGDLEVTFPASVTHYLPVYGLYGDSANTIVLTLADGTRYTHTVQTEPLPELVKPVIAIKTSADYFGTDLMFVSPTSKAYAAGYDYRGDCRWCTNINLTFALKRLQNGRLILGTERLFIEPYSPTGLYELGMIGKIYAEYRLPGGYHHDQVELPNGDLLVLTCDPSRDTAEDMCVLLERTTGNILKSWDYTKLLPTYPTGGSGSQTAHDWFHNNAVWYDERTRSLSLSGRHQDIIINVDFDKGTLNWILGDPENWPEELVKRYFFTPVSPGSFEWQYEQHACLVTPEGDIMCFDNGHYRAKDPAHYRPARDNYSRGVRYKIDPASKTIEQVWQYGKERGADFYSCYISNVDYYRDGHYLVHSGGIGHLGDEVLDTPCSFLEGKEPDLRLTSTTVEIQDGQVMYEMQLPANYYRARRLPLYSPFDQLTFGKGQLLGSFGPSQTMRGKIDPARAQSAPAALLCTVTEEIDLLRISASYGEGDFAQIILVDSQSQQYLFPVQTTSRNFTAMCVGTFQKNDKIVEKVISKEGLPSESYHLYIQQEDILYDTHCTVSF